MTQLPSEVVSAAHDLPILSIAREMGASLRRKGSEWNGPCPGCGGTDRFWLNEDKNTFLCRMSGAAGDPINLARHVHGIGFADAVAMLTGVDRSHLHKMQTPAAEDNKYREKARQRAWKIWRDGRSIDHRQGGYLVAAYLALRSIPFPQWTVPALREIDQLAYWEWSKEDQAFRIVHTGPAMMAAIVGPDGHFIGVHRTWLDLQRPNGKALISDPETGEVLDVKKVMGSQRGGRIILRKGDRPCPRITGEGIETVLSFAAFHGDQRSTLQAGINLDNIAGKAASQIPHPSKQNVDRLGRKRRLMIGSSEPDAQDTACLAFNGDLSSVTEELLLGDADSDRFTTQAAMLRAKARAERDGRPVSIRWAPDGLDWNDALRARAVKQAKRSEVAA
ncbi:DUF7146 domain-containing protein [Tianweitania sediminis]|uniref:Zinc finger CHC2-type domain-containing protein n=1 Tax=Tianweitania sediminis TaxID=1502156 RepID=A0A8J7QYR2_9HYPH|nr:CHC2 zinc finger domain-containing protein [Tianweitania sediminis]MBP0438440.1 hypothetical protein [Tianweitania sediminis]